MSQGVGKRIPGLPEGDKVLLVIIPASKQSSVYLECGGMTREQVSGAVRGLNSTFSKPDRRLVEIADGKLSNVLRCGELGVAACRSRTARMRTVTFNWLVVSSTSAKHTIN